MHLSLLFQPNYLTTYSTSCLVEKVYTSLCRIWVFWVESSSFRALAVNSSFVPLGSISHLLMSKALFNAQMYLSISYQPNYLTTYSSCCFIILPFAGYRFSRGTYWTRWGYNCMLPSIVLFLKFLGISLSVLISCPDY